MGVTENCLISSTTELLSFTWVLRGNFTFINSMIPMSFKGQNQEVLLSGSKLKNFQINLILLCYVRNIFKWDINCNERDY